MMIAIAVAPFAVGADPGWGDTITRAVWSVLAVFSLLLVRRLSTERRGAWCLVAFYCSVVAADKWVDLQTAFYHAVRWLLGCTESLLGLRDHKPVVRVLFLVLMTIGAVGGTVRVVWRDQRLDGAKKLAVAGLVLVLLLIGVRLLPGLGGILDESACWVLEGAACALIVAGLCKAWPRIGRGAVG
jgi:hypothetical protein